MRDLWGEHHLSLTGGRPLGDSGNLTDSLTRPYMDAVVERHGIFRRSGELLLCWET